jgi:hypothetical protein
VIVLQQSVADALDVGDKAAVLTALQQAIELEHATIPVYLYALYSIVPGKNSTVAAILRSVVVEEMLHLVLAANVLNALGGSPVLDAADFIPSYPGPLPGAVDAGVAVRLAPCSIELVRDVFMPIEEPEHTQEYATGVAPRSKPPLTIGRFYRAIEARIADLGDGVFTRGPRHQLGPDLVDQSVVVTDVASARRAIDIIVDQGEGTANAPLEVVGNGYAHYYRFAQIAKGGQLVPNPRAGADTPPADRYVYDTTGHPVAFDPAGIFALPANPKVRNTVAPTYPMGSTGRAANDAFNATYTSLLKALHATVNGRPERLGGAIGMMHTLRQQAVDMASGAHTAGQSIGPSFEFHAVDRR